MDLDNPVELRERIVSLTRRPVDGPIRVIDDTSNYMGIAAGTVLRIGGSHYYVTGEAKEGRFGIVDQPKFWVKYALDLNEGSRKILKLVFHEQFSTMLGTLRVSCRRDPDKESRVLALTAGDPRFMQGRTVHDRVGNNVRVLDYIGGKSLYTHIANLGQEHEVYFHETMPGILRNVVGSIEAIARLHEAGEHHGDVRNDHIIIETGTGRYRWIDFDFTINYQDYDIWSVGNILTYTVGGGIRTCKDANKTLRHSGGAGGTIGPSDALLFFGYRLANLRKLYPYVPKELNDLLMRFSAMTEEFYEDCSSIARDLRSVLGIAG